MLDAGAWLKNAPAISAFCFSFVMDDLAAHRSTMRRIRSEVEKSNRNRDRKNVFRATVRFMDGFTKPPLDDS